MQLEKKDVEFVYQSFIDYIRTLITLMIFVKVKLERVAKCSPLFGMEF